MLQGGTITTKIVLDNSDMFAGMVLIAPAFICCPRYLTTSSVAVSDCIYVVCSEAHMLLLLLFYTHGSIDPRG